MNTPKSKPYVFSLLALLVSGCLTPDVDFAPDPMVVFASGGEGSGGEGTAAADMGGAANPTGGATNGDGDGDMTTPSGGAGTGGEGTGGAGSGGVGSGGVTTGGTGSGGTEPRSTDCYGTLPTLFLDEFEDGSDCWTTTTTGDWDLLPSGGYSDSQGFSQTTESGFRILAVAGEPTWDNVHVQAYIKVLDWGEGVLQDQVALIARYQNENDFYYVSMSSAPGEEKMRLKKSEGGVTSQIGSSHIISGGWQLDTWYQIAIEINGTALRGFVNGVPRLDDHMDATWAAGEIAIGTMSDATIVVDGVRVTQL